MDRINLGAPARNCSGSLPFPLDFIELRLDDPPLNPRTLKRWRTEQGSAYQIAARACPDFSQQLSQPEMIKNAREIAKQSQAIAAFALCITTSHTLRPTTANQATLRAFFSCLRQDFSGALVWESSGLWEAGEADQFARELAIAHCIDPSQQSIDLRQQSIDLRQQPSETQPLLYSRFKLVGTQVRTSDSALQAIAQHMSEYPTQAKYLVIEGTNPLAIAKRLNRIQAELAQT